MIGRGDYHWQHEPCWYAVRTKGNWTGDRKQTTLWTIPSGGQDTETVHGTQKPVECMRRPMQNNSSPGQAVYEPFLGSGTTLIAAETAGSVCFGDGARSALRRCRCPALAGIYGTYGQSTERRTVLRTAGRGSQREPYAGNLPLRNGLSTGRGKRRCITRLETAEQANPNQSSQLGPTACRTLWIREPVRRRQSLRRCKIWNAARTAACCPPERMEPNRWRAHRVRRTKQVRSRPPCHILRRFCDVDRSNDALQQFGTMIKSPSGYPVQSPYVAIANRQAEMMLRIAGELASPRCTQSQLFVFERKLNVLDAIKQTKNDDEW